MLHKRFTLFLILLISTNLLHGQEVQSFNDIQSMDIADQNNDYKELYNHHDIHAHHIELSKGNSNELEFVFSNLFMLYKGFISSQDFSHCMFSPSCSEYGIIAIKKIGFFEGIIATFDRLTRCHPLILPGEYEIDEESGLFIDEPQKL